MFKEDGDCPSCGAIRGLVFNTSECYCAHAPRPPCSACTEAEVVCDKCGWVEGEEFFEKEEGEKIMSIEEILSRLNVLQEEEKTLEAMQDILNKRLGYSAKLFVSRDYHIVIESSAALEIFESKLAKVDQEIAKLNEIVDSVNKLVKGSL